MAAPKYQIFVSSTYLDLKDERDAVVRAILEMGHIPVGMELFSAANEEQWAIIARTIDECDYYVVIVAHRYGSLDGDRSFTEKEYDYAIERGVPALGFVIDPAASWPSDRRDGDTRLEKRLGSFKEKVRRKYVGFWRSAEDLRTQCAIALMKSFNTTPRPGWVRSTDVAGVEVTRELTRLSGENAELRSKLAAAATQADADDESHLLAIVDRLEEAQFTPRVFFEDGKEWESGPQSNLLEVFGIVGPTLQVEATKVGLSETLGTHLNGDRKRRVRRSWPFPRNMTAELLADFAAFDLVGPSSRKHSLKDENEYWSLTELGRAVLKAVRKVRIVERAAEYDEKNVKDPTE